MEQDIAENTTFRGNSQLLKCSQAHKSSPNVDRLNLFKQLSFIQLFPSPYFVIAESKLFLIITYLLYFLLSLSPWRERKEICLIVLVISYFMECLTIIKYEMTPYVFLLEVLTLIVLHKYTHVKPAALPYLRVTAAAVLNKSVELDWN